MFENEEVKQHSQALASSTKSLISLSVKGLKNWLLIKLVGDREWENSDDRRVRFLGDRCKNIETWDESDIWDLSGSLAKTIYKRLVEFDRGFGHSYLSSEEWEHCLDEMRFGFWFYGWEDTSSWKEFVEESTGGDHKRQEKLWNRANHGIRLFAEHFGNLWI
jgi:hypothetical protein